MASPAAKFGTNWWRTRPTSAALFEAGDALAQVGDLGLELVHAVGDGDAEAGGRLAERRDLVTEVAQVPDHQLLQRALDQRDARHARRRRDLEVDRRLALEEQRRVPEVVGSLLAGREARRRR